jgi:hypothetical protein
MFGPGVSWPLVPDFSNLMGFLHRFGLCGTRFFEPNGILRISAGRLILLFTKDVDDFE